MTTVRPSFLSDDFHAVCGADELEVSHCTIGVDLMIGIFLSTLFQVYRVV